MTNHQGSTLYVLRSKGAGPQDPRPLAGELLALTWKGGTASVTTITAQLGEYESHQTPVRPPPWAPRRASA